MKAVKIICVVLACIIGLAVLIAAGYVIYVAATYSRIEDNLQLEPQGEGTSSAGVAAGGEYKIMTYNIGFGAYLPEYSFFMDTGVMNDGTKTAGKYGKALAKDKVQYSTEGVANAIKAQQCDFVFAQEVDEDADRSFHVNQLEYLKGQAPGYQSVFAQNFHSAYLFYPFNDPHGKTDAGILTLSAYNVSSAVRRSFPVATDFSKFFDLDRCFSVSRVRAGERELVLINLHMSAYDEGGVIRAKQMEMLLGVLNEEKQKGNYVIAGGDFNHDICNSAGTFKTEQQKPDWVATFPADSLPEGFAIAVAQNKNEVPTCRSSDIPYQKDVNYTVIIDGFIISDNIEAQEVTNIDTQFAYSDHNPVVMKFKLK